MPPPRRDLPRTHLELDFPSPAFTAALPLLRRCFRLFADHFGFLLPLTLGIYLPGKLAIQFLAYLLDIPTDGLPAYLLLETGDLLLGALLVPAVVYGLVQRLRGAPAPLSASLRWGRRQWLRTLGNDLRVEVTIGLYLLLLIVPGILASLRLAYVEVIVAVEADTQPDPLLRSATLARGRLWRIFCVLLPLGILNGLATYLLLDRIPGIAASRPLFALAESLLALTAQLGTIATLLMYLGTRPSSHS